MQRFKRHALAAIALTTISFSVVAPVLAAPVTFAINYTYGSGVDAATQAVVQTATDQTFANIASWFDATAPVTIRVDFNYFDQGNPNLLGSAGPTDFQLYNGVAIPNALYRFLNGAASTVTDPYDMVVNMNAAQAWDFTFATPANPSRFSYAETLYHEGFHALGFLSTFAPDGSYGLGVPSAWDNQLQGFVNGAWQPMSSLTQAQRASVLVSDTGYRFNGANAVAVYGSPILMYAPTTFEEGSSNGSHIRQGQAGLEAMYSAGPPGRYLEPSLAEKSMLADIGWRLSSPVVVPEAGTLALILPALGLVGTVAVRRRKSKPRYS